MNKNATALILIVLSIGIYFTVTKSAWDDAMSVKDENSQYASAIAKAEELISVRDSLLEKYKGISVENKANLDKMIPNTVDNIRLINDLNHLANDKLGLTLKGVRASLSTALSATRSITSTSAGAAPLPVVDTVKISFGVSAQYAQFISLMKYLEANLRMMDLTHLSLSANDSGTYDFSVELNTYWLRQ